MLPKLYLSASNSTAATSQNALQFLEAYSHEDVTTAELQGSSNSLWTISPPSRQYLSQVLNLDQFPLTMSWTIQRWAAVVLDRSICSSTSTMPPFLQQELDSGGKSGAGIRKTRNLSG